MNKMIVHYCGGAGINISKKINDRLSSLGEGFCEITPHYMDTSHNNIGNIPKDNFWKIESSDFHNNAIAGSGGERKFNAKVIMDNINQYLDEHEYKDERVGEFHVVVFSASGGTGSVCAPVLIRNLRVRGIPVLGVVVGDSSNGLSCKNTMNTIASLDSISKSVIKKPVVVFYYNNHMVDLDSVSAREDVVNEKVFDTLTVMSLFLSGDNDDIDTKDMINFISPDKYESIKIAPSLYTIDIYSGSGFTTPETHINLIGRTLMTDGGDAEIGLMLLQHKYGRVVKSNALNYINESLPLHIVLAGNCLTEEHSRLQNTVQEYDSVMNSITSTDLSGTAEADDGGMIF